MTAHKRFTNSKKTKYSWSFVVDVPSGEYDINGKEIRKQKTQGGFNSKKEALEAEKDFLDSLSKGKIEINKTVQFSDIMELFLDYIEFEACYAKGTISNYKGLYNNHLSYFKNIPVAKINPDIIKTWRKTEIENGTSQSCINECIKLLKASFNYGKSEEKIKTNPFEKMKKYSLPRKLRKRFSIEKLKQILESCRINMPYFYCILVLSCTTGMRLGEYTALSKEDIDFDCSLAYIEKQYTRREMKQRNKTVGSTRISHLSENTLNIIKWHILKYEIFSGLLFKGKYDKPVSPNWVNKMFKNLLELNGYPRDFCRVHDLRGQYVDVMKALGAPTSHISREIGHSRTSTTDDIYTQILNEIPKDYNKKMDEKLFGNFC